MNYAQTYDMWAYLFKKVGVAYDMTGGYVDQDDLDSLLKNPSKANAKKILLRQIYYWFEAGIGYSYMNRCKSIHDLIEEFPRIAEIASELCIDIKDSPNPFVKD